MQNLFKISFSLQYTSNLVTDFNFELLTETFRKCAPRKNFFTELLHLQKNFLGGNYLAIPIRIASRYQRCNQNLDEHPIWKIVNG